MDNELRDKLIEFKALTELLIKYVTEYNFQMLEDTLKKRDEILKYINNLEFSKGDLRKVFEELEILKYHNKLQDIMLVKKVQCKNELIKINKQKQAFNSYNKSSGYKAYFIKEEI